MPAVTTARRRDTDCRGGRAPPSSGVQLCGVLDRSAGPVAVQWGVPGPAVQLPVHLSPLHTPHQGRAPSLGHIQSQSWPDILTTSDDRKSVKQRIAGGPTRDTSYKLEQSAARPASHRASSGIPAKLMRRPDIVQFSLRHVSVTVRGPPDCRHTATPNRPAHQSRRST